MTKLIVETDNEWTKKKIEDVIHTETEILNRTIDRIQEKLKIFELRYGTQKENALHGKIDDMDIVEWEGEIETLARLKTELQSLEEIAIEYK